MKLELQRILDAFSAVVQRRRGNIRRIESDLVQEPGYFSRVISGRRPITLERLVDSLDALDQDVGQFFCRQAFPEADLYRMLDDIPTPGRDPGVIKDLRRGARRMSGQSAGDPVREPEEASVEWLLEGSLVQRLQRLREDASLRHSRFVLSAARRLDDLRFHKPWDSAKMARILAATMAPEIVGTGGLEAFCASAGAFASAHRVAGSLDIATRTLREILPLSDSLPPAARADFYLRVASILADYARYEDGLLVAESATKIYADQRDGEGMGRAFVSQGLLLLNMDRATAAAESYRLALALLPKGCIRFRIPALQGLALVALRSGEYRLARAEAEAAIDLLGPLETYSRALLFRLRGDIERADARLPKAEEHYREATRLLVGLNPFDCALVTLDLIAVLLDQGEVAQAVQSALGMNSLLQPLSSHPVAEAALLRLRRLALRGELDLVQLEVIRQRIVADRIQAT
jgi:tetratricopeptide (TPR) repeat protein